MKIDEQAKRLIQRNSEETVLGTGYSLSTIREDLEDRESTLQSIERWTEKIRERKFNALKNASDADFGDKIRHYRKGEQARGQLETLEDLHDKVMVEQLFLSKLVNQHLRQNYVDNTTESFGFQVDIAEMDAGEVSNAIDRSDVLEEETVKTIQEIDEAMSRAGDVDMPVDLSEVRREAEELEADELESEIEGSRVEDQLDRRIDQELREMDVDVDEQ